MAQFDVHRNIGRLRDTVPFVVVVQSSQFDDYRRRVVVPLVKANTIGTPVLRVLNPMFKIEDVAVILHPLDLVSVATDQLGERVGSLAPEGDAILTAIDEVLTRTWK